MSVVNKPARTSFYNKKFTIGGTSNLISKHLIQLVCKSIQEQSLYSGGSIPVCFLYQ